MTLRARKYIAAVIVVVLAYAYGRIGDDWSVVGFYGGLAGLIAVAGSAACFWMEFAPDGAFRRQPRH